MHRQRINRQKYDNAHPSALILGIFVTAVYFCDSRAQGMERCRGFLDNKLSKVRLLSTERHISFCQGRFLGNPVKFTE